MGLLGNGERRGWERIQVSGWRIRILSVVYGRDTLAACSNLYQCSVPAIIWYFCSGLWVVPSDYD